MSSAFIDRDDKTHCKSCGAPVQVNERSCPWCTTAYPADARPATDISATWDDDEDPSYGGYWVGAGMARPRDLFPISGARSIAEDRARWRENLPPVCPESAASLHAIGAIGPNEVRAVTEAWDKANRTAQSYFGLSAADTQKPRTDDPLLLAVPTARPPVRPQAPLGRIVSEAGPWPFQNAIDWLKGLFK